MKVVLFLLVAALMAGCGSSPETNVNSSNLAPISNTRIQNVDANNLPPGLSASPMAPPPNGAPGIPINANSAVNTVPEGTTPTPGIPDPKTAAQPMKPGATPTPGIPDPETLKRQMEQLRRSGAANVNQRPAGSNYGTMILKNPRMANSNRN